jgi:hypothetical protein
VSQAGILICKVGVVVEVDVISVLLDGYEYWLHFPVLDGLDDCGVLIF